MNQKTANAIRKKIADSGLKATHQRMVIYNVLKSASNHPTAEEVHRIVKTHNMTISLGTVYKTLDSLIAKKMVRKVPTSEGKMRYDAKMRNHNHIYYTNTNEIVDYEDQELNQLIINYLKQKNIKNLEIDEISICINAKKNNL